MTKEISHFVAPLPAKTTGRFVQVFVEKEPFIRFSLKDEDTHEDILIELLNEYIQSGKNKKTINYESAGKGFYKTLKDKTIQLYGDVYMPPVHPNKGHLDKLTPYLPKEIKIEIKEDY
jgi:hypothetical protein